jgi:hypothetical protein
MGFPFPIASSERIVDGREGAHRGGVRHPIPTCLRYEPFFPPSDEQLEEIWAERRLLDPPKL